MAPVPAGSSEPDSALRNVRFEAARRLQVLFSVDLFNEGVDVPVVDALLGPATYVSHESELPMAVIWRLEHALPGDLFATFAAAVA